MPERLKLAGVALCKPYKQGDLDNLCGLYAALNAIRLVAAPTRPLNRMEAEHLFQSGIDYLDRKRALADVVRHGMEYRRQHAVMRHMARSASGITGVSVAVEQAFPKGWALTGTQAKKHAQIMSGIADRISFGSALILELRRTWRHYTVISGISPSRVLLFDSDGLRWVERRALGTTTNYDDRRHYVRLSSVLEVTWEG